MAGLRRKFPGFRVTFTALGVLMLAGPTLVILAASFTRGNNIVFPPHGLTLHWYGQLFTQGTILDGLKHSLYVATIAVVINCIAGVPAALALSRWKGRGSGAARLWLSLGILSPIVVSAFAFYIVALDLRVAGDLNFVGLGIAVVTFPFMVWTITSALNDQDPQLVEAAATLGADPVEQFLFVRLPLLAPGIVTGCLLVFVLSITDFMVSLVLTNASSATLPVTIYSGLRSNVSPLLGAATVLFIVVATAVSAIVLRIGKLERFVFRR
jgi:putative spermidine/putrescine transport system permease protein